MTTQSEFSTQRQFVKREHPMFSMKKRPLNDMTELQTLQVSRKPDFGPGSLVVQKPLTMVAQADQPKMHRSH